MEDREAMESLPIGLVGVMDVSLKGGVRGKVSAAGDVVLGMLRLFIARVLECVVGDGSFVNVDEGFIRFDKVGVGLIADDRAEGRSVSAHLLRSRLGRSFIQTSPKSSGKTMSSWCFS